MRATSWKGAARTVRAEVSRHAARYSQWRRMNTTPDESWREDADRRVHELAEMLHGCVRFGNEFRNSYSGGLPTPDSPARARAEEHLYGENALAAFDQASSKIVVVEDLLRGFATLLGPPPETPFALQVLLRSVLEVAAAAWYFADSDAEPRQRAARVHNEHIENHRRNASLAANARDEESRSQAEAARAEALERLEAEFIEAEESGLMGQDTRHGRGDSLSAILSRSLFVNGVNSFSRTRISAHTCHAASGLFCSPTLGEDLVERS